MLTADTAIMSDLPRATPEVVESQTPEEIPESMREFYQLQRILFSVAIAASIAIASSIWVFYSLNVALNYILGAIAGMLYLRRMAKDIEGLGGESSGFISGVGRMVIFIGTIFIATQVESLQVLPVFLGFLTYKVAILIYAIQSAIAQS